MVGGFVLLLAACGSGLDGTYADTNGMMSVEFDSDKAYVTTPFATIEAEVETKDDKVILRHEQGNLVLTRGEDDTLESPMGSLKKKKS